MPKRKKDREKYTLTYPSYITEAKRMWVTEVGDIFVKNGQLYKVIQVLRPRIRGAKPQIVFKPIDEVSLEEEKKVNPSQNEQNNYGNTGDRDNGNDDYIPF
jgi:hypothetical protein